MPESTIGGRRRSGQPCPPKVALAIKSPIKIGIQL
jgi:hypothetical protein